MEMGKKSCLPALTPWLGWVGGQGGGIQNVIEPLGGSANGAIADTIPPPCFCAMNP